MRIGHVVPTEISVSHLNGGAVQRRVRELSRIQTAAGHVVFVFSPREAASHPHTADSPRMIPIPLRTQRPLADYEYLAKAAARARGLALDVMHAHGAPEAARFLSRSARISVQTVDFFRYRSTNSTIGKAYFRQSLNMHDAVLPVSEYCKDGLIRHFEGLSTDVRVVPNGVDIRYFAGDEASRQLAERKLSLPATRFVLYLGRVTEQKGSDMLPGLGLCLRRAGYSLVVAGPTERFGREDGTPLLDQIRHSGAHYLGPVPEELLPGLLSKAELLVLPTRRDEMFGMVLIEAGAAGTPAVASAQGGIPEAMGGAGRLFPVGDQGAFETMVLETLKSPAVLAGLQEGAVLNAARFAWPRIAAQYESIYTELLSA